MEDSNVIELRQYTLHPGRRDELIELFEREFVEPQEALGMRLIGLFRDIDDADRFVWLRGFADMRARRQALTAFYGGPVWQRQRGAANATMVDSDNVLLLRPAWPGAGFATEPRRIAEPSLLVATICELIEPADDRFVRWFIDEVNPLLRDAGGVPLACLHTESAENDFPALPVRSGEQVLVWFSRFTGADGLRDHDRRLAGSRHWSVQVGPELLARLKRRPTRLRLAPTAESRVMEFARSSR